MHRRRPGRGLLSLAFPALLIGVLAASQVSLAPDRPAAEVGELDLAVEGQFWTSDPIRVDATAIALTWQGADPLLAAVRVSDDGESWGLWTDIDDPDDHGPDPTSDEADPRSSEISEAVYVGSAGWLQFRIVGKPSDVGVVYVDTTGRSRSWSETVQAFLGRIQFGRTDAAVAAPVQPDVLPRSTWGGDQCRAAGGEAEIEYHDGVQMMFVHHTVHSADSNHYEADEVADLLYAICSFHVSVRGWVDIGYNALIDKYGRVWEGRAGGLDQPVQGAHTGGFNSYSTGVALIGDHRDVVPTPEAEQALIEYAAWKLDAHNVDPRASVTVESFGSSRYEEGVPVTLGGLSGHRDASLTACPGSQVVNQLEQWAERIALTGGPKIFTDWHHAKVIEGSEVAGYTTTVLPFSFTEEMNWSMTIVDEAGNSVFAQTGVETAGTVTWDGTFQEQPLPHGVYTLHLDAVPTSGAPNPRPATFDVTLGSFNPPFSDDEGSVHEPDIGLIAALGITTGCAPEQFCPGRELARWQMALFLTRLHTIAGYSVPDGAEQGFTDVAHLPPDYQLAINQLAQLGVTLGTGEGTYGPEGVVSREQMALFLVRWSELAGIAQPEGSDQGFSDIVDLPVEHQVAINRLAQLGITTGTAPGTYSPDGVVTREQMASFLTRSIFLVPGIQLPTSETESS